MFKINFQSRGQNASDAREFRKAEPQQLYHLIHEPSEAVSYDRSTGLDPGMARNDATIYTFTLPGLLLLTTTREK